MILDEVKEILADFFETTEDKINSETNIFDDLGASKIDLVDIAMNLEDQYSIEFSEEVCDGFKTVDDIVLYIEANLE